MKVHNPLVNINLSVYTLQVHFVLLDQLVLLGLVDLATGFSIVNLGQSIPDNIPFQTSDPQSVTSSSHIRFGHGLSQAVWNWKARFFQRGTRQLLLLEKLLLLLTTEYQYHEDDQNVSDWERGVLTLALQEMHSSS